MANRRREIVIGTPRKRSVGETCRVELPFEDTVLWFESNDLELEPLAEAFATAMLPVALLKDFDLRIDAPVDANWRSNIDGVCKLFSQWWGCSVPSISAETRPGDPPSRKAPAIQCFTGGADSFHTLLEGSDATDALLYVHGFDIPVDDMRRFDEWEPRFRRVAETCGKRAVVVRTNLRTVPRFRFKPWDRTHGAALAAVGHLLSGVYGQLLIPASFTYEDFQPWGTSWDLDPCWSSSRLQVVHGDASVWRTDKLRAICTAKIVQDNLRVCFHNLSAEGNCSRCEKCVRTMLVLHHFGELHKFTAFDRSKGIEERLDEVPLVPDDMEFIYRKLLARGLEPPVGKAVNRLLRRSRFRRPVRARLRGLRELYWRGRKKMHAWLQI